MKKNVNDDGNDELFARLDDEDDDNYFSDRLEFYFVP